ncbi:nucleoside-diphosphate sugar epimerase, partial [Halorubrum distributum]
MNTPTGQSILVTGGAGFIGSRLVETLVTDNDVTVLDNLSSGRREWVADQATLIEADIRDSEAA